MIALTCAQAHTLAVVLSDFAGRWPATIEQPEPAGDVVAEFVGHVVTIDRDGGAVPVRR